MIRVMYSDGIVYESAAVTALWRLHDRLERADEAAQGKGEVDRSELVDVVSLSFGGFFRDEEEKAAGSPLLDAINALRKKGVIVVAAAGNFATPDPFYPAALADDSSQEIPVISVGALNPNGTRAYFSNEGQWVKYHAQGVSVVSTVPRDMQGPLNATMGYTLNDGTKVETMDPDDFSSGFALWSGTSFATAFAAADIANALEKVGDLDNVASTERLKRAKLALGALKLLPAEGGKS
jgi:hypothetical protein